MGIFSNPINDNFDNYSGSLLGYYESDLSTSVTPEHHYTLRSFDVTDISVPFTQLDYNFWHGYKYNSLNVGDSRDLGSLAGIETWAGGTVAKNSSYRYSYTLSASIPPGALVDSDYGVSDYGTSEYGDSSNDFVSYSDDDILTGFSDPNRTYYIELVLRAFPAQTDTAHFDLTNCFINFSSTTNFDPAHTDSLAFSTSLHSVSAGGDTYLRFPRTALVNADLKNLKAVGIRLVSTGGTASFVAQELRMVDDLYAYNVIDINTKTKELTRSVPQSGGSESSTPYGAIFFKNTAPKNTVYITAFNSGHNPTGNDNIFRSYLREKSNLDHLEITLTARDTQSRISIYQTSGGVGSTIYQTPILSNALTNETYYFFVTEANETQVRGSIYAQSASSSVTLGNLIYTTGWQTVALNGRGLIGYSFEPYNYDFKLQFVAPQSIQFGTLETTPFNSRRLVRGATLYPSTSSPENIIYGLEINPWGDAGVDLNIQTTTSYYGSVGYGTEDYGTITPTSSVTDLNGDVIITRSGTQNQGGITYGPFFIGDSSNLTLEGSIWATTLNGSYNAAIIDQYDNVLWTENINNLLLNTWTDFSLLIPSGLLPENSYLILEQSGEYADTFRFKDISLSYTSLSWSISPDGGTTWQPFLGAINGPYTGVMFSSPTASMLLRGIATTDQGWISGYQLRPNYQY